MKRVLIFNFLTLCQKCVAFAFAILFFACKDIHAQPTQIYKPNVNRVLFALDISGSMTEKWGERPRYEIAKDLLYRLIDSVEKKNPNVEFALRGFGYQYDKSQRNCKDSKLLVPFAKNNAAKIQQALAKVAPHGMTPIAYSLQQAVNDFPADTRSLNSIIIITDGNENCDGNPCDASQKLLDKRISLRPFIVGLNGGDEFVKKLKCIGQVLDAKDEPALYNTVGVIIKQTLNTTTAQVNLLDATGNPTVTNIPFTLYDHASSKMLYNFVHTFDEKGNPDTLYLDPVGIYDLELHTYPIVRKENIELTPGKHNLIAIDVPVGDLTITSAGAAGNNAQVIVRTEKDQKKILNVQDLNEVEKYLAAGFRLEILTKPETLWDTTVVAMAENNLPIPNYGTLSIMASDKFSAGIFREAKGGMLEMVDRFDVTTKVDNRKYQPGDYFIVYKSKASYDSEATKSIKVVVKDSEVAVITLE